LLYPKRFVLPLEYGYSCTINHWLLDPYYNTRFLESQKIVKEVKKRANEASSKALFYTIIV
jgi:hypothetical protein